MSSFLFWHSYKIDDNSDDHIDTCVSPECELHLNLWDMKTSYYLDIGFYIEECSNIDQLFFYSPFEIKKSDVSDLGGKLNNKKLVDAIFNASYSISKDETPKLIKVENSSNNVNNKKAVFNIYSLSKEQYHIKSVADGSQIVIDLKNCPKNDKPYYFRIRINISKSVSSLSFTSKIPSNVFSELLKETEVIDFRLNELRSCNDDIKEIFFKETYPNLRTIHYLILRESSDVIISHEKITSSRILEKDLWSIYNGDIKNDMIAYHIKEVNGDCGFIEKFSHLVRFQYSVVNFKTYLYFLFSYVILSYITGLIIDFIHLLIKEIVY